MISQSANAALVQKVRKLLAKAEATDNPNEAEAFSLKAAALIAAHRLDAAHVRMTLEVGELRLQRIPMGRGAYTRARLALLSAVARNHDCELVFETGPDGTIAVLAGYDADLDVTALLYESLHLQAAAQMARVRRATPAATQRWRRSFLLGYAARVGELLADTGVDELLADARASATTGARRRPPTLFDDAAVPARLERAGRVRAFAADSFGRVVTARPAAPATRTGWHHGQRAAAAADLGRPRVRARRALDRGSG